MRVLHYNLLLSLASVRNYLKETNALHSFQVSLRLSELQLELVKKFGL